MMGAGNVTETDFFRGGGTLPGLCKVVGTVTLVAGAETINLGANDTNVSGSASLRRFIDWGFTNQTAARAPTVTITRFDPTQDGDILVLAGTGTDVFNFWIEGYDSGS